MKTERVFQKHVVDGSSFFFDRKHNTPDDQYELRDDIAQATNTSINDVIIIGSAKLGFSVKTANFLEFDHLYTTTKNIRDKSDIDIALVNSRYFDEVAESIYHLSCHFDRNWIRQNWTTNQYYLQDKVLFNEYSLYVAKGWLRPDFMPNSYLKAAAWQVPCDEWSKKLNRKVAVGIYSNWTYLKHYHMDHLSTLQSKLLQLDIT